MNYETITTEYIVPQPVTEGASGAVLFGVHLSPGGLLEIVLGNVEHGVLDKMRPGDHVEFRKIPASVCQTCGSELVFPPNRYGMSGLGGVRCYCPKCNCLSQSAKPNTELSIPKDTD